MGFHLNRYVAGSFALGAMASIGLSTLVTKLISTWISGEEQGSSAVSVRTDSEVSSKSDEWEALITRRFLTESEWGQLLRRSNSDELAQFFEERLMASWATSPVAESVAYRISGALAQPSDNSAVERALLLLASPGNGGSRSRLYWALLGGIERQPQVDLSTSLARLPSEHWPEFVLATVMGTSSAGVSEDIRSLRKALSHEFQVQKRSNPRVLIDKLLEEAVEGWIRKDPIAVLAWLRTPEAKPFAHCCSRAIASAALGEPRKMVELLQDVRLALSVSQIADACYGQEWNAEDVGDILAKLPGDGRSAFLAAYAKQLTQSPVALVEFVGQAGNALLTPEVAAVLGPGLLRFAPHLWDKLTRNLDADGQAKLLDASFQEMSPITDAAAELYLNRRGADGSQTNIAIGFVASRDLGKALAFAQAAPEPRRGQLVKQCYEKGAYALVEGYKSVDEVFSFLKNAPSSLGSSLAEKGVVFLTTKNADKGLEMLTTHYPSDAKMWSVVFENARFKFEQLDKFLAEKIKSGIEPAVYAAAAVRMTAQFAEEDIDQARAAIEELTDPKVRQACINALVATWSKTDPLAASTYVAQLPVGRDRDSAIALLLPALGFAEEARENLIQYASSEDAADSLRMATKPKAKPGLFEK